jgi:hypothetical protein
MLRLGIVDHLRRRSATADSSCGEFAGFKSAAGRTRCGVLGAHLLDLRCLLFQLGRKSLYLFLLLRVLFLLLCVLFLLLVHPYGLRPCRSIPIGSID